jgi:PTS system galactitol-specific IIA component
MFLTKVSGSNEDALRQLADFLFAKGYVAQTYADALIQRERSYPTGIQLPSGVNVALPHADAQHVHRQALVIGIPDRPTQFHSMEDASKVLDAHLILLLVIKNPDGYVKFLANLTLLFQKPEFAQTVKEERYEHLLGLIAKTIPS